MQFEHKVSTYLDARGKVAHFLRKDHFERLSRMHRGYLREITIAAGNFYTTYQLNELLDIYSDHNLMEQFEQGNIGFMEQLARRGCLVLPYQPLLGETRTWSRLRTDVIPKYLSPLGKYNPPYVPPAYATPEWGNLYALELMQEAAVKAGNEFTAELFDNGMNLLRKTGFFTTLEHPSTSDLPLVVVEGEFKALSIFEAWLEQYKRALIECYSGDTYILPVFNFQVYGIVGVWGMMSKAYPGYNLRSEWRQGIFGLESRPRKILVCFDSDAEWNINIAHAATTMAYVFDQLNCEVQYVTIPSVSNKHKLGADDYMIEEAANSNCMDAGIKFVDLLTNAVPIGRGLSYPSISEAITKGFSAMGYLKAAAKGQLT